MLNRVQHKVQKHDIFTIFPFVTQSRRMRGDKNRNMIDRIFHYLECLSERKILLSLLGITFGLRLYAVLMAAGVANDSAGYGFMARDFLRGEFLKGLSPAFHPLYAYLISLLSPGASYVEITGRLISLFFGTVTLVPVYYWVKEAFGQRVAVFSGLFYCFHPYLVTYSGMLLSEATYWSLLTLSIYFFWFGLKRGKIVPSVVAGFLLGLAYLTRPEGVGYLVVFLFWIIIYGGVKRDGFRKAVLAACLILSFLVPSFPYLLSIHQETGQWLISKKSLKAQPWAVAWSKEQKGSPNTQAAEEPKPTRRPFNFQRFISTFLRNLPFTLYHYVRAYHFTLWPFLFFGLIRARQGRIKEEWFLASLVLFHLFSIATFNRSTIRFSVPVIPLSLLWAGAGVVEIQRFLKMKNVPKEKKWLFFLVVLILLAQLPQALIPERWHRREQKNVGVWLRQNTPEDSVIMSNSPQEAFYANRPFVQMQPGNPGPYYRDVIRFAKENRVRYILIDRYTKEISADFVDSLPSSPDLKEIYRVADRRGNMTTVYHVFY